MMTGKIFSAEEKKSLEKTWKIPQIHCYKYKLTKPGSGGFLATPMLKQVLNSAIECLQEQELEKNCSKKNYAGTSIEKIQYLFLHNYNIVPT